MKAAYVKVPFEVEIRDIPVPEIGPDEVLVRTLACGICGTDLHFARQLAREHAMPLGHEFAGVIEQVGKNVSDWQPGQAVIVENHTACGVCPACKNGQPVRCTNLYVVMQEPCLAEFVRAHRRSLHDAAGLEPGEAALAEPLTVAMDVAGAVGIELGDQVAVFGPGTIGLMAVVLARRLGAGHVFLVGRVHSSKRLELGRQLGADRVVVVDRETLEDVVFSQAPSGLDRVIITSPPATIPAAIGLMRFGGVIAYNGIDFDRGEISFDANEFHFKRLQLRATHSIPNLGFPTAIELIRSGVIHAKDFITHRFAFQDLPQALQVAENDKANVIKVMIDF